MNNIKLALKALVVGIVLVAGGSMAQAQTRSWLSGVGDDANPCSRTAPCKTFEKAHLVTATGGEINALTPGAYGTVTITKSMTIDGGGTFASILSAGTTGIIVNAPGANVVIRNIDIHGAATGIDGIKVLQASSVVIENVNITGFTGVGINWSPSTADGFLTVNNVSVENCALGGVSAVNTSGFARVLIQNSLFHGNLFGVKAGMSSGVTVNNSSATNCVNGFLADGGGAQMNLDRCTSSQNTNGVAVNNGAAVRISNSVVSNNVTYGLRLILGYLESYGTNMVRGNPLTDLPTVVPQT